MFPASLWKPWYVHRPRQIFLRAWRGVYSGARGTRLVTLPWGSELEVDIGETVGRSVWTVGVYDLTVTEVLYRLVSAGDFVIDAGANIGYMTSVMTARLGRAGEALCCEPHPQLFERLTENVHRGSHRGDAPTVRCLSVALSDRAGATSLVCQQDFNRNQGTASLEAVPGDGAVVWRVETDRLDDLVGDRTASLLKLDVEGHEENVLRGAERLCRERRIGRVVFEDHEGPNSSVCQLLENYGYRIFQLGWHLSGLRVESPACRPAAKAYEAPNYLATLSPSKDIKTLTRPGWHSLNPSKTGRSKSYTTPSGGS